MIIKAVCSECDKRIGYVSITGEDVKFLKDTLQVKSIAYGTKLYLKLFCDDCREGRNDIDLEDTP